MMGAVLATATFVCAAEVWIPTVTVRPGDTVTTRVEYRAHGTDVSALSFDLACPDGALSIVPTIGREAKDAGKELASTILPNGNVRVLVYGLNDHVIGDGSLVELMIAASADSSPGRRPIRFVDAQFARPSGEAARVRQRSGHVVVTRSSKRRVTAFGLMAPRSADERRLP